MGITNKRRACIYCGNQGNLTVDHVPPKLLFAPPLPRELITVPACRQCNQSFQKDDEYTRTVVAIDLRASKNRDAQCKLPAILRSLQNPNAKAFAEYLAHQTTQTTILAPDGAPMGQAVEVDRTRVNATGARIIRGLYFSEIGKPLERDALIKIGTKPGLSEHDPDAVQIARCYSAFPEHRDREIGTAFSYVAGFGPGVSVWMMLLYDYFAWVGTVDTRASRDAIWPVPQQIGD